MPKEKSALITSRDSKGRHALSLFEATYNKARLNGKAAQQLNERGNEFQSRILSVITDLSSSSRYIEEEEPSWYGYPASFKVRSIPDQVRILRRYFPYLSPELESPSIAPLPKDAEGWFAIPRWERVARVSATYGEAVERVMETLHIQRQGAFFNWCQSELGPTHLRQHSATKAALRRLGTQQRNSDILLVPAQFGIRHRGRSIRRVRECVRSGEFCLGAFAVGIMLLTHPERLDSPDALWIDCAGDEFSIGTRGTFDRAPRFAYFGDTDRLASRLDLGIRRYNCHCSFLGSASAFLLDQIWQ